MEKLKGVKVAILATDGFEEEELVKPMEALKENGAEVHIIAPEKGKIKGWNHGEWGNDVEVDYTVSEADADDYDALLIPGGVINPDKLRRDEAAVQFASRFFEMDKPVASICHGPQMLIEAEVVKDRTMTSFFSIKKDLQNAGANWVDKEVVVDGKLITSRNPGDIKVFNKTVIEHLARAAKG
jgi:protease I